MKKRIYHIVTSNILTPELVGTPNNPVTQASDIGTSFDYQTREIDSEDTFEGELFLMAFPITQMERIDEALRHFNLYDDLDYFYQECREVVARPERHINEKGQGKLSFQSYFHQVPRSLSSINNTAIVVVALYPTGVTMPNGQQKYEMVCYIHANEFQFEGIDRLETGYYYNMLRVSEKVENGVKVYRRKKIFTCVFSILHDLANVNDVDYVYASMGRENQAINDALDRNVKQAGKYYERLPVMVYSHFNRFLGRKKQAQKMVNISNDTIRLLQMYRKVKASHGNHLFFKYHNEVEFIKLVKDMKSFSESSNVWMLPDENGEMTAAVVAMNWGDYFALTLENAKGLIKLIAGLTEKVLYPFMGVGEPAAYKQLLQGIAYHYRKEHGVALSFLLSYSGDPYAKIKKSMICDEYYYFMITKKSKEDLHQLQDASKDEAGNVRLFTGMPIL